MTKIRTLFGLAFLVFLSATPALSQNCTELNKLIDGTYNFKPSKLTSEEQGVKSTKMDAIWKKVEADPKNLLPCLRAAISARTNDTFFRFDAASLLVRLDQSAEAKKLLIRAYADVDFNDIDLQYWMPVIAKLGFAGLDTTAAAETWLKHPNPEYSLAQHGTLAVDKQIGAMIAYGSMDESLATPALAKIAAQEGHPGREIAVLLLLTQATPESFAELKRFNRKGLSDKLVRGIDVFLTKPTLLAKRDGTPKTTRQQFLSAFQQLVAGDPSAFVRLTSEVEDGERDVVTVMLPEDIPLIRKARRAMMLPANPHTGDWYGSFSSILITMVWKPEP